MHRPLAPIAYLTAELKSRDLDSRLLIAGHLLQQGVSIVVGQQWSIFANYAKVPKGCYFFKTLNVHQAKVMAVIRDAGHLLVASDEEALCGTGDILLEGVHAGAMSAVHLLLAQNEAHKDVLTKAYPSTNIAVAGSARIDLMRMARERMARPLSERYVLFNTNFPFTNGYRSLSAVASGVKNFKANLEYEVARREHLVALIKWAVTNLTGYKIVIRPHPGEKIEPWQEIFRHHANVIVVGRSDPAEWIRGAEVTIISDSTTGLEAAVMGAPCLNISPAGFEHRSNERLMSQLNFSVSRAKDAVAPLVQFLLHKTGPLAKPPNAPPFPHDGARKSALAVTRELERHGATLFERTPQPSWFRFPRLDSQVEKFNVPDEEARSRAEAIFNQIGLTSWKFAPLDDSVFYFST